jgi:hypothetical protein
MKINNFSRFNNKTRIDAASLKCKKGQTTNWRLTWREWVEVTVEQTTNEPVDCVIVPYSRPEVLQMQCQKPDGEAFSKLSMEIPGSAL